MNKLSQRDKHLRQVASKFIFEAISPNGDWVEHFKALPHTGNHSAKRMMQRIRRGDFETVQVKADGEVFAYLGFRVIEEEGTGTVFELNVVRSLAERGGSDLMAVIEEFARNRGATVIRGFTIRPGLLKKLFAQDYTATEIIFEKSL